MARRLGAGLTALALGAAALAVYAALGGSEPAPVVTRAEAAPAGCPSYRPVSFHVQRAFLVETMADVGRRADVVVLGTVVAELTHRGEEFLAQRRGTVPRYIRVRVDRTLWRAEGATALPPTVLTGGGSWWYERGERSASFFFGRIGGQYLFVFFYNGFVDDTNGLGWGHDSELAVPILDGRTPRIVGSEKPFFDAIECKTADELEAVFAAELGANS